MSLRALITGASGFVGSRLQKHLETCGWEVVPTVFPPVPGALTCNVQEEASIAAALESAGEISHVFHLAAIAFVPDAARAPLKAMDINLQGTLRLCQAMERICPQARLIFIGSSDAYGPPQYLPVDEQHPFLPQNIYAISKAAADQALAAIAKTSKLEVIRVRPFNHAGPGQSDAFVLPSFARQVAEAARGAARPVMRVGNLQAARDFLHVDDVVRAYEILAREGVPGEAYNICAGQAQSIQDALDTLRSFSKVDITVENDPARMRPVDVPTITGSHAKLTERTGWEPAIPFDTLLRNLFDFYAEDGAERSAI